MTWTTAKPTKPGRYELSIEPGKRDQIELDCHASLTAVIRGGWAALTDRHGKVDPFPVEANIFDGAQWREYQEPADPFAHAVTVTDIELPHDRGSLRIEDDGESVKAIISPGIAGGTATDRLRDLRAAVLSAGEWLTWLCDWG